MSISNENQENMFKNGQGNSATQQIATSEKCGHGNPGENSDENGMVYPSGRKIFLIMIAVYLVGLLVALDRTIIATAIPRITDDFNSLDDIAWYGGAYMVATCTFQLIFGRIYTFYDPKVVYLVSVAIFEAGSALCGAAPRSSVFIFGRAIAGLGACGLFSGNIIIVTHSVPLRKRPIYTGLVGAVFGIASVVAPLLGGAFTDRLSWRWCFYINLPIGAVTFIIILATLRIPTVTKANVSPTLSAQFIRLDPVGNILFLPSIVCLLLALQWGGFTYSWSSARIVILLVLFGILFTAFVIVQILKNENATVPPRIIKQRCIAAGAAYSFCLGSLMMVVVYYLPIWFQAIKGVDAVKSGIMTLPLVLTLVLASIIAGGLTTTLGYFTPWLILGSVFMSVGVGLLTTFSPETEHPKWIGYQCIIGMGIGLGMQQPGVAAQTVLTKQDLGTGISLMFFSQALGGSIFLAIAQNIFANTLTEGIASISGLNGAMVMNTGVTDLRKGLDGIVLVSVLRAYNNALVKVFYVGLGVACASIAGALGMEWQTVKKRK